MPSAMPGMTAAAPRSDTRVAAQSHSAGYAAAPADFTAELGEQPWFHETHSLTVGLFASTILRKPRHGTG